MSERITRTHPDGSSIGMSLNDDDLVIDHFDADGHLRGTFSGTYQELWDLLFPRPVEPETPAESYRFIELDFTVDVAVTVDTETATVKRVKVLCESVELNPGGEAWAVDEFECGPLVVLPQETIRLLPPEFQAAIDIANDAEWPEWSFD